MTASEFISKFNLFPEEYKKQLLELASKLWAKVEDKSKFVTPEKKIRQPGCGKGFFGPISDAEEFNKPLDDFKEYM